jgi:hypothetical protein
MKVFTALVLAVALTGCAARQSSITNVPPGVTQAQVQAWDTAVANLHKITVANSTLRQTVISLHSTTDANGNAVFPNGAAYVATLTMIGKIAQTENAAATFLQGVPNSWPASTKAQIAAYMNDIAQTVQTLNTEGVTGITNTASQKQVNTLISEITSSVTIILAL